jgi:hypothetical protein
VRTSRRKGRGRRRGVEGKGESGEELGSSLVTAVHAAMAPLTKPSVYKAGDERDSVGRGRGEESGTDLQR